MYFSLTPLENPVHLPKHQKRFLMEAFTDRNTRKKGPFKRTITINPKVPTTETTNPSGATKTRSKPIERALVWSCVSEKCNAWKRMTTYEETLLTKRECPICASEMLQMTKEF